HKPKTTRPATPAGPSARPPTPSPNSYDCAVLLGSAERAGGTPLSVSGVVVADAGGKGGVFLLHAILSILGIPCHIVFDGDCGGGDRLRAKNQDVNAQAEDNKNQSLNRSLLRYLGEPEVDWPVTAVHEGYSVIADKMETLLDAEWPECASDTLGLGKPEKNARLYRHAARNAATDPPPFVKELLEQARNMAQ
ncbi:TOPRIM nucleotidyl transferase/hydrolase domain-containing protein, partial [Frankia sp. KB5]|uniref:TOPRIM nucleotidyl transferase/hydrolase domain-containing protein n=1 Tax=Frankia sp. KB5 TaxID=683318 RepID=UPI001A7E0C30